jgi:hypothetical protein
MITDGQTPLSQLPLRQAPGCLLAPAAAGLATKLATASGLLGTLWPRFRARLDADAAFRAQNLFLLALLPDTERAILRELAETVIRTTDTLSRHDGSHNAVEHHTWCVAPQAMRMAAYTTWLDGAGVWENGEREIIGTHLLDFCETHAINVLRSRTPTSDNQSMALALTCAVAGTAFAGCDGQTARADTLRQAGLQRLEWILGLTDADGYTGEGPTYQSHVVTPLAMWTAALLESLDGPESVTRVWAPGGVSLLNLLRVETLLPSPGRLLPGIDHHGWQRQINLAGIAYWARAAGHPEALADAEAIWDDDTYIAWGGDDRMWTLLYWPDDAVTATPRRGLSGWSLPHTAAALDDHERRTRLLLCYDRCAESLQGVGRGQTNPNHLLFELDGAPIFADGKVDSTETPRFAPYDFGPWLDAEQRRMLERQFGSVARWGARVQEGFVGAANAVVIDGAESYFQPHSVRGRLVFEERTPERHIVSADARPFYQPFFDLTRATRAIAMTADGVCLIVDDLRAETPHDFAWQVYLRTGCTLSAHGVTLRTRDDKTLSLAWLPAEAEQLDDIPDFPLAGDKASLCWPETGSQRLRLTARRDNRAQFVVCLLPNVSAVAHIEAIGKLSWRVRWDGGEQTLSLPPAALAVREPEPLPPMTFCDLDETPYPVAEAVRAMALARLDAPAPEEWRSTIEAMQGLAPDQEAIGLPRIHRLLMDPAQRYQVHSVAAWRLGRAAYAPALADLRGCAAAAEPNLARRAAWAAERIGACTV